MIGDAVAAVEVMVDAGSRDGFWEMLVRKPVGVSWLFLGMRGTWYKDSDKVGGTRRKRGAWCRKELENADGDKRTRLCSVGAIESTADLIAVVRGAGKEEKMQRG